MYKVPV